jgi:hypothetical protein
MRVGLVWIRIVAVSLLARERAFAFPFRAKSSGPFIETVPIRTGVQEQKPKQEHERGSVAEIPAIFSLHDSLASGQNSDQRIEQKQSRYRTSILQCADPTNNQLIGFPPRWTCIYVVCFAPQPIAEPDVFEIGIATKHFQN